MESQPLRNLRGAVNPDQRVRELELLMEVDHAISLTRSLDEIYGLILVEGAKKLIHATHGSVALVEDGELVIKATMGDDWTDELRNTHLKIGEGITGWVAKEGKSQLLRDVRQAGEQYASWFEDVKSELAVPLRIGERVRGVINVDSTIRDCFSEHDQQLLEALAGQAGIALQNAEYIQAQKLLMNIDRAISSTQDVDKIYEMILVEGARKLIGATHGSLALVEDDELVIKATMGDDWTDEPRNAPLKVGEGITGWVAKEGKPYLLRDVRQAGEQYAPWFKHVRSELAVPLKIDEQVVGVINVDSTIVDGFDSHDQDLLELLASEASIALITAKMQDQLLQEENIKAVGMATAELTHWIGNKALPILFAVERVIDDIKSEDESILEDLDIIQANAKIILALKESLLGSSLEFQMVPVMIGDIVKDTVHLMAIPRDTKLRLMIEPRLPLVRVDHVQFSQVLENLIKNALDAMDTAARENELTIRVYLAKEERAVKIEVQDNGCGIAKEHLEKIWIPFYSTKKGKGGTGIGLSVSAQIIRKMQGRIHVESELEEGTIFTIELPMA
jgi:signal transduction histidine kinase